MTLHGSLLDVHGVGTLLLGPSGIGKSECALELICRVVKWREGVDYDRVGLERPVEQIAGVSLPSLMLPARPGGSMATVVDVAVREHRLRSEGVIGAQRLDERLRREMGDRG